jgi:hypothetical protein
MSTFGSLLEGVRNIIGPKNLSIEGLNPNRLFRFEYQTPNGYGLSINGKLKSFTQKGLNITLQIEDEDEAGKLVQIITQKVVVQPYQKHIRTK